MATLELKQVRKNYGNLEVIHGIDLFINNGEFCVLVGPSGCGKSTLLRMIAGLEQITKGDILIDEQVVNNISAARRGLAMVFQSYALYPHMSVRQNLAFGLENLKMEVDEIDKRILEAARLLRMEEYLQRKPGQLSGGQKQRVAIGRAIVREPSIYLFDEPLSNLDAELRVATRVELKALHARLGNTMIYVTHDQVEAMTMADKIVVMNDGIIEQVGAPLELYNKPSNKFVAGFIGSPKMNFIQFDYLPNSLKEIAPSNSTSLGIRPEHLSIKDENSLSLNVETVEQLGSDSFLYGTTSGEQKISIKLNYQTDIQANQTIKVGFKLDDAHWFDKDKALHARLGNTMIYVTHDQVEAMTMADKIVVMNDGIIEQVGAPLELYNKPSNKFVAGFIGSPKMNFIQFDYLPNSLKEIAPSNSTSLGIRPEHLSIKDENSLSLNVETVEQLGSDSFLYGTTSGEQKISIKLNYQTDIQANQTIKVGFKLDDAHWFDKDGIALTS